LLQFPSWLFDRFLQSTKEKLVTFEKFVWEIREDKNAIFYYLLSFQAVKLFLITVTLNSNKENILQSQLFLGN
jgi:hypothetical protein